MIGQSFGKNCFDWYFVPLGLTLGCDRKARAMDPEPTVVRRPSRERCGSPSGGEAVGGMDRDREVKEKRAW